MKHWLIVTRNTNWSENAILALKMSILLLNRAITEISDLYIFLYFFGCINCSYSYRKMAFNVIKWKPQNTTLSEQFQNQVYKSWKKAKIDTDNTHIHDPAHCSGLEITLQL
jgi:hypothetical protein